MFYILMESPNYLEIPEWPRKLDSRYIITVVLWACWSLLDVI